MTRILPLLAASTLAGCAGVPAQRDVTASGGAPNVDAPRAAAEPAACPMALPFTTATLAATDRGGAITFTTGDDQVEELRRRVRALADSHNALHPSRASAEPVDHGARLVLSAEDAAKADGLRGALYSAADYMRREGCEMAGGAKL